MTTYSEFQPTHIVDVRAFSDCYCDSCRLALSAVKFDGFRVTLTREPLSHVIDHDGRRVYTAQVHVDIFGRELFFNVRVSDLISLDELIDRRSNARIVTALVPTPSERCDCGDCRRYASFRYYFDTEVGEVWVSLCVACGEGRHATPPGNEYAHSGDRWHGGKVDDGYAQHGEFASQVRCEDERHYEPDPYDADDAWR